MNSSDCFRVNNPNVIHEVIDGEVVIVNLNTGNYYIIDKLAADIWTFIDSAAAMSQITDAIADRYEGNRKDIGNAINQLVNQLVEEGLIVLDKARKPNGGITSSGTAVRAHTEKLRFEEPVLNKYTDMEALLLLDPIHDVDETGWPNTNPNRQEHDH